MPRTPHQAAAEAIFDAYEARGDLTEAEWAMKPAELAAARAIAAMDAAARAEEAADGWSWAIVEVMGHRRHVGRVREEERYGTRMLRVDVPIDGDPDAKGWRTHFYAGSALFGETPCTRDAALAANRPYEPPARLALPHRGEDPEDDGMPF
ncbi:hypothetical protein [Methylobacterium brachiatum]|uniref:hypothetical protein n=1 Tax=Methylobacterium brachiatum TaxID=269660 RepID=UPI0024499ECB|nr:hypothetical protein [Methylobacterium brachiatum]MDH2310376.1 hypothetical protein [Methylobacterium brachiatum]